MVKLRDALKKEKGGMIGVTIGGKQKWFKEDDFMAMFEKEETKPILLDAIKHGRDPERKKKIKKAEFPELKPKVEIPETKKTGKYWDESEPEKVFEANKDKTPDYGPKYDISGHEKVPPKPTDEQMAKAEKTPMQEIEGKATDSPYGRKDEYEAITPKNFPVFEKRSREKLKQHLRKFDFLKTLHPKEAARRKIAENEESWFDEFAQSQGRGEMSYELIDDYKKDKDEDMRRFIYDLDRFLTKNREAVYDLTNKKFLEAKRQKDELVLSIENQLDAKREEMNEIVKAEREEAKKYTPENRVKDLKAYSKAKKSLADAEQEQDKDEVAALTAEIKLLEDRLGVTGTTEKEELQESPTGLKNEDKMRAHLKSKGFSDEKIESTLKEYAARKG